MELFGTIFVCCAPARVRNSGRLCFARKISAPSVTVFCQVAPYSEAVVSACCEVTSLRFCGLCAQYVASPVCRYLSIFVGFSAKDFCCLATCTRTSVVHVFGRPADAPYECLFPVCQLVARHVSKEVRVSQLSSLLSARCAVV